MPNRIKSKPRSRGSDKTSEILRGKNRELHKTIRQLESRIAQLEKQLGLKSTIPKTKEKDIIIPTKRIYTCEECGKGEMKENPPLETPGGVMIFMTCEVCKHRKRLK